MKSGGNKATKELYNQLRALSCDQLWKIEVARFNQATPQERLQRVAVIRAVGVVFSESGSGEEKAEARQWLSGLLADPCEKIRRYAMTALPKLGAGPTEEGQLLSLLRTTAVDREKKFLGKTLDKIGGAATLEILETTQGLLPQTEQKVKASVARAQSPSAIRMDSMLRDVTGLRIHLRGRKGLESFVRAEVEENLKKTGKFRILEVGTGCVAIAPVAPFSLADLYALRCFGTASFLLGSGGGSNEAETLESLASVITSPLSRRLLETFAEGPIRYRLDFVTKGHQRGAVRTLANRAYALCPEILNDARNAPWAMNIYTTGGATVELSPKLTPDPRFYYRQDDVPAASHPPLAACMARLAGRADHEIIWDPFCGSGLELIERALLGDVQRLYGTDLSADAIAITEGNFAASGVKAIETKFTCCDFRDFAAIEGLEPNSVSLIITNPPMGRRVPIPDLQGLIEDLFHVAHTVLKPGGRLVFANPLPIESPHSSLRLQSRQVVDFGGFHCRLEKYLKQAQ